MGTEVVEHHPDAVGIRVVLINKLSNLFDEFFLGSFLGHIDVTPPKKGLTDQKEVTCSGAAVGVIGSGRGQSTTSPPIMSQTSRLTLYVNFNCTTNTCSDGFDVTTP